MNKTMRCPCWSGKVYEGCCRRYHDGVLPENALALMRSRYAAYALGLADYIMATTHPDNPAYTADVKTWKQNILEFSKNTRFEDLKILEFIDGPQNAYVTFTAYLKQSGRDATFTEKSYFVKEGARWLYHSGEHTSG